MVVGNPTIHNGPAWLTIQFIAQEPQINVIEGKWQRHSYPIHAGGQARHIQFGSLESRCLFFARYVNHLHCTDDAVRLQQHIILCRIRVHLQGKCSRPISVIT